MQTTTNNNSNIKPADKSGASLAPVTAARSRFNVKYIGSAILHKNFTLPMLEWIAKDIRRQTIRGAQSTSQRQFTIPIREISFEIEAKQLRGVTCKDGHCIFVHPMHCVSKYAQLQHDPTCFSYLIRDSKEAPYFCHVFQAKSAAKVHDIFRAIREATTRHQLQAPPAHVHSDSFQVLSTSAVAAAVDQQQPPSSSPKLVQKSASSSDGQLARNTGDPTPLQSISSATGSQVAAAIASLTAKAQQSTTTKSQQATTGTGARQSTATNSQTFENSYQFEVMFVKKVKLQCRRVPVSFVDDALETLKSFEVALKGGDSKAQMKGIGKRIISASVDERQEYDEICPSPTGNTNSTTAQQAANLQATQQPPNNNNNDNRSTGHSIKEERESRSCQQSPTKTSADNSQKSASSSEAECSGSRSDIETSGDQLKKHLSMDSLRSVGCSLKAARDGTAPTFTNDFSPYSTITSTDLNERIAAIPVVSSSVSLDHETRQKLARQVRETIMATAANIKKDVYASGDKLDKLVDSLSCTVTSSVPAIDSCSSPIFTENSEFVRDESGMPRQVSYRPQSSQNDSWSSETTAGGGSMSTEPRRSSLSAAQTNATGGFQQSSNNFDLFRRASAREVVKNRTMLLLIGTDELCTISIDKHQMLFSKSFSSIVHCLQGNGNKDHFGLICRDSGKINPQAETYAGFIFKCQSEKLVREIMGTLKQVIYSSHHNSNAYNSIYNPLNSFNANNQSQYKPAGLLNQQPVDRFKTPGVVKGQLTNASGGKASSLANERNFLNHLNVAEAAQYSRTLSKTDGQMANTAPVENSTSAGSSHQLSLPVANKEPKNLIKSMFCDDCPLYWFHRLCCDIESLPAEASKAIILRRIDSSLPEKEQDEVYSRFSEFNIDSIEEHNEIFMSLLRHLCERKQLKHSQTQAHLSALAKSAKSTPSSGSSGSSSNHQLTRQLSEKTGAFIAAATNNQSTSTGGNVSHQRSVSTSGSLAFVLNQSNHANQAGQSIADASTLAIDNLKKAKNSISVSIENIFKRKPSMSKDETATTEAPLQIVSNLPSRSGSFKSSFKESRASEQVDLKSDLKRSQSTSDYSNGANQSWTTMSWKDSLSRTINDDLANPFANLFTRRGSMVSASRPANSLSDTDKSSSSNTRSSAECLSQNSRNSPVRQPASPSTSESRFSFTRQTNSANNNGGSSPSSMLSSAFWKKSIFDKIRQPTLDQTSNGIGEGAAAAATVTVDTRPVAEAKKTVESGPREDLPASIDRYCSNPPPTQVRAKRTSQELRGLWRKAILEQITLLKMDRQNQRLQANAVECDIQRIKLNYRDVVYGREVLSLWEKSLKQDPTKKVEFVEVARLVRLGVPKQRRGEVWMFLMNQYQLRHGTSFQPADSDFRGDANQTYRSLLSQLSVQQHEIFVDIGRTFPSHPYYSQCLSIGQLSLFNLLKAYSLLDPEVGYCQGLSFVAGILLLHVNSEDEAFELMRHLLFNFGLRKQYLPSMNALHLQLYQITRLLRDHEYDLFNHFDHHDISPSLYAAPWFLTLFASQFPLGFVARLLDLIFLIGIEAIFRVSLNLLAYHKTSIVSCNSLESTMQFMKSDLVKIDDKNLVRIFDKSLSLDLRNKLIEYEIEYTFYCAEDRARLSGPNHHHHHHHQQSVKSNSFNSSANNKLESNRDADYADSEDQCEKAEPNFESTSIVADATATVIIQHLLANNHLKSLRSNYSY